MSDHEWASSGVVDLASDESRAEMYAEAAPKWGGPDYNVHAALFNDIARAPESPRRGILFSDRKRLADYLFAQGWRRDLRPDDYTR